MLEQHQPDHADSSDHVQQQNQNFDHIATFLINPPPGRSK
jgi:hypothetical protein